MARLFRVLLVDDFAQFRDLVRSTLQKLPELEIVGEASDGLDAVQKAQELQPDLILLDISLPSLNGIEAASLIRTISPASKILFLSVNRSWDIAEAALRSGGGGYIVKSDAARDLLPAVKAVLQSERFVSATLTGRDPRQGVEIAHRHEVGFYSDDQRLLGDVTQFIGAALTAGNAAIVAATESHRNGLFLGLQAYGVDVGAATEQGRYIALDAADVLSTFMVNDMPEPVRFMKAFGDLIVTATTAAKVPRSRVAIFGESVHLLWAKGNAEAAIQTEKLGNGLTRRYDVDILCGYSVGRVEGGMDAHSYQQICAEHSAVYSR